MDSKAADAAVGKSQEVGMCEGGAGSDAGELEHSNMQPLNTYGTQKVRSTPKGGNIPHIDISRPNVNNVIVKEVSTPQDKWGHECHVHRVWGPWESNWRPDCIKYFPAAG